MSEPDPAEAGGQNEADRLAHIRAVGARVRTELRVLLNQVPDEHAPVSALSRWINVNRSVCHRSVAAARVEGDAADVLRELPGVDGLEQFVQGFLSRGIDPVICARGASAVEDYKKLIGRSGGSQSKLVRMIEGLQRDEAAGSFEDLGSETMLLRQRWHELAVQMTGLESETLVVIHAVRMASDEPRQYDWAGLSGNLGITRRQKHLPIVMIRRHVHGPTNEGYQSLRGKPMEPGQTRMLIPEFCSSPLPQVVTRHYPAHLVQLIDPSQNAADPLDVIIGQRILATEAKERRKDGHKFTMLPRVPAKRLVMDVHLHDSVPRGSRIGGRQFFAGSVSLAGNPAERWFDRLDDLPTPRTLGRGLLDTDCAGNPRHQEMTRWIFDQVGWNPDEFTGYRMDVRMPLWSVEHLLHFPAPDFMPDEHGLSPDLA